MKTRILMIASASALALMGSSAALAANKTTVIQDSNSSYSSATVDQHLASDATSTATVTQSGDGTNTDAAAVVINQGATGAEKGTNTATVEQKSNVSKSDVYILQKGSATGGTNTILVTQGGGSSSTSDTAGLSGTPITQIVGNATATNDANALQTGGGSTLKILQNASGAAGSNKIGSTSTPSVGITQTGTGTVDVTQLAGAGAVNDVQDITQSGSGTVTLKQQGTSGGAAAIGRNTVVYLHQTGGTATVNQYANGDKYGGNEITKLIQSAGSVTINQTETVSAGSPNTTYNTIGAGDATNGLSITGGTTTINQTSSGATYDVYTSTSGGISGGTVNINQLDAAVGAGTVAITSISGGTVLIDQTANNAAGTANTVNVLAMVGGNVAIRQLGDSNTINVDLSGYAASNNPNDDGTTNFQAELDTAHGSSVTFAAASTSELTTAITNTKYTIEQDTTGYNNTANLNQSTIAGTAHIFQAGHHNNATVTQATVNASLAYVVQLGSFDTANVTQ